MWIDLFKLHHTFFFRFTYNELNAIVFIIVITTESSLLILYKIYNNCEYVKKNVICISENAQ